MKTIDLMECPGAWYGTNPKPEYANQGHLVIDPAQVRSALKWLNRRCFVGSISVTTDQGLFIRITPRS